MKSLFACIFLSLLFVTCSTEEFQTDCSVPATVRDLTGLDGCGFVFELEDGSRLEPLRLFYCGTPPLPKEVTEDPLYGFEFKAGKKVFISYEVAPDMASVCMVGPIVKITCLTEVPGTPTPGEGNH